MQVKMPPIPLREALHFMGWRGTPVESSLLEQIQKLIHQAQQLQPYAVLQRFGINEEGALEGTTLTPQGKEVGRMLSGCHEAVLLGATLGAASERMLLKAQARSGAQAVLLDAVLSAAIEAVCDAQENTLRSQLAPHGLYLTDRFSPGYGDMPITQTKDICAVLAADKHMGLTVSASGIMIPRKSVTAIMGISRVPVSRRPSGCAACSMRGRCALSQAMQNPLDEEIPRITAERTD